jgi:hypothetical protein
VPAEVDLKTATHEQNCMQQMLKQMEMGGHHIIRQLVQTSQGRDIVQIDGTDSGLETDAGSKRRL